MLSLIWDSFGNFFAAFSADSFCLNIGRVIDVFAYCEVTISFANIDMGKYRQ